MIMAVGIHIVDLAEFRERLTDDFISGAFLPEEARYAGSRARCHESYAGRFAAKEAVIKALGCHGCGLEWNQIEVLRNSGSGEVGIRLHGNAALKAARKSVEAVRVSISHCGTAAMAVVVLERSKERKGKP